MKNPTDATIQLLDDSPLTRQQIAILKGVRNGADVWGYAEAGLLRGLEKTHGSLITIVKAVASPPGHMRQPYFGCVCTTEGKRVLAWLNNPSWPYSHQSRADVWKKQGGEE